MMLHIPPPNSSSSFKVFAVLREHNFGDIRMYRVGQKKPPPPYILFIVLL